jgi:hypothetical protein
LAANLRPHLLVSQVGRVMAPLKQAPLIGLLVGAAAWAISTQLSYSLVSISCDSAAGLVPLIATISLTVAIVGGALSQPASSALEGPTVQVGGGDARPRRFFAVISALAALIFALAILLQGVASLIVSGCQR